MSNDDFFSGCDDSLERKQIYTKRIKENPDGSPFVRKKKKPAKAPSNHILIIRSMADLNVDLTRLDDLSIYVGELRDQDKIHSKTLEILKPVLIGERLFEVERVTREAKALYDDAKALQKLINSNPDLTKGTGLKKPHNVLKHLIETMKEVIQDESASI